jgi:hypothetical protein
MMAHKNIKGSALVFTVIIMAGIIILGIAAFTLFYRGYQEHQDRAIAFNERLNDEVITQNLYTSLVVAATASKPDEPLITEVFTDQDRNNYESTYENEMYTIVFSDQDGNNYKITYDGGIYTFTVNHLYVEVRNTDFKITVWQYQKP